jgi:hypothetical protein
MPILGGAGVVPQSTTQQSIFLELNALTRRAFIPRVTVQIYYATPTLMMLLGGAQKSAGGLNQITGPVQGNSMVQGAWTGYAGQFNKPQVIPGVQNFAFNTAYFIVPVPLVLGEALLQSTEAVVPILDVRMNDVYAVTAQQMGSAIFTNNTANTLMPSSFVDGFDNGVNIATYGGINRNTPGNSFWQGQYYNFGGQNILTRQTMAQLLIQITDNAGGETVDFVVMSPSDYAALNTTFIGTENVYVEPGRSDGGSKYSLDTPIRSSFPNLNINGIPFYLDHWCPKGTMFFVNSKYTAMYLSEDAPFVFSGFYSTIPIMQVAQVGVMIVGYQIICAKPSSCAIVTNFTGGAF